MRGKKFWFIVALAFVVGLVVGSLLFYETEEGKKTESFEGEKIEEWTCSMHPQIRQRSSGKCPICGMDLVKVGSQANESPYQLVMSEQAVRLANIQTTKVVYAHPEKIIYLNGKVQANEKTLYRQVTHLAGRIERLHINFTGEKIREGQLLATIYSPELVNAQKELLEAPPHLVEAVRTKLKNWKLSESQIAHIEQSGKVQTDFPVFADVAGVVSKIEVRQGDYVQEGQSLFEVADLRNVWILLDAYETDLAWLQEGQKVVYQVQAFGDKKFESRIEYISPFVHPENRTATVRLTVDNSMLRLKPEMLVMAQVFAQSPRTTQKQLVVPKTAVLWSGTMSVVYVKHTAAAVPTFEMREIVLGESLGDYWVVNDGLREGEEVVTNGVFALDATAQLQNKASLMNRNVVVKTVHFQPQVSFREFVDAPTLEQLEKIVQPYFSIKDALVAAGGIAAKEAARPLLEVLKAFQVPKDLPEEGKKQLEELLVKLQTPVQNIIESENIDAQRKHFISFSEQIILLVKLFGGVKQAYVQTCPMADNNKGATWLSLQKEIRNPYYGEMMLTCGEVLEKIE